jgi:H+/Cl- antiporter ClcA
MTARPRTKTGALFALEEGTTHWDDFLTWRTFVCAMVSGFTLALALSAVSPDGTWGLLEQQGLITFGSFKGQDRPWAVQELPLFMALGCVGGAVGALLDNTTPREL